MFMTLRTSGGVFRVVFGLLFEWACAKKNQRNPGAFLPHKIRARPTIFVRLWYMARTHTHTHTHTERERERERLASGRRKMVRVIRWRQRQRRRVLITTRRDFVST